MKSKISNKKNYKAKKEKDKVSDIDNWINFGKSILKSLIYILIFGIIGSNFLYIIRRTNLEASLPSSINNLPYNKQKGIFSMKGGDNSNFLNKLYPENSLWFPYSFPYDKFKEDSVPFELTSLFTQSIAFVFANSRSLTYNILTFFKSFDKDQSYLYYLYPLIILLALPFVPIVGTLLGIIGGFITKIPYALVWLVLCLLTIGLQWGSINGLLLLITYIGYFVVFPLLKNDSIEFLKNTLKQYKHGLLLIWSIYILKSAYSNLGSIVGNATLVAILIGVLMGYKR